MSASILLDLVDQPRRLADLRSRVGSPAQSTLRALLKRLVDIGALDRRQRNRFPGVLEYELTESGHELIFVIAALERWLADAPTGALPLGGRPAKAAVTALADGWSTSMLRALAAKPLSLTDLDRVISAHNYPSLERRLSAMRLAGQVEARPGAGKGTPYEVTRWLRTGMGPMLAAMRWGQRHRPGTSPPPRRIDIEAIFLLAAPLLNLPPDLSGSCHFLIEIPNPQGSAAHVMVEVAAGRVCSCSTRPHSNSRAQAVGPLAEWLSAMTDVGAVDGLSLFGSEPLAISLVDALRASFFPASLTQAL